MARAGRGRMRAGAWSVLGRAAGGQTLGGGVFPTSVLVAVVCSGAFGMQSQQARLLRLEAG